MKYSTLHRLIAAIVFLISLIQFITTAQVSVSFWDPGELSAAAHGLLVPHPPGGPLFYLVGRIFYMLPFPGSPGFRMNMVSATSSAVAVLFLYLVIVRLIHIYKKREPQSPKDAWGTYLAAAIGALALSFSDTFWFNGVESNYFAASTLMFSAIVWLILVWYEHATEPGSWKYFLMIALLVGLTAGIHLMSVLTIFTVAFVIVMKRYIDNDEYFRTTGYIFLGHVLLLLIVALAMWGSQTSTQPPSPEEWTQYDANFRLIMLVISIAYVGIFWKKIFSRNSFYLPIAVGGIALAIVYPGVIKKLPDLLRLIAGDNSGTGVIVLVAILAALGYLVYWSLKQKKVVLAVASTASILTIVGFTTYTMIIIRANVDNLPMDENNPNTFSRLVTYLNREQYGDFPMFKRRWSAEPQHAETWTNYSSDLDFFWRYQMDHMFNRYVFQNFIGRESFDQDAGVSWEKLFGIPFFIGLFGLYYHFRRDWKMASAFVILFIFMGYLTAFYQNQQQSQPRDREYFYAGVYFVFAVWIALGIRGLIDLAEEKFPGKAMPVMVGILALGFIFVPGRMLQTNYFTHDRSKTWLPWDYSYNLLQSCAPNSILFTNGDNDTFPLWYLQDVEAVRRDLRIVNLSLVNTDWYILQLKHDTPFGTPVVKIALSDDYIRRIQPIQWKAQQITLQVPRSAIEHEQFNITDSSVINRGAITFTMQPTLRFGDISAIRVQDIMVKEIVQQNAWQRPIYFAATCGEDTKIGLNDYLKMEGMAARLVPQKRPADQRTSYVDTTLMRQNLMHEVSGFSTTYQTGFKFRGLSDKSIFYDENQQRMTMNYRSAFLMLATNYLMEANDKADCIAALDRMEQVIPRDVVPMDYRMEFNVAVVYDEAGDSKRFNELAADVEKAALARIDENPNDVSGDFNPYRILTELYSRSKQYAKAADLLERLQPTYPNDAGLRQEIQRYRALAAGKPDTNTSPR